VRGGGCSRGSGLLPVRAPIVGQQPQVVADTVVADTVVGAVSDTAGKAVPAGVAGHAPPESYVPGSGAGFPAKLRLVLAGYAGIACGLFAGALFCAAYAVFVFFFVFVDGDEPESVVGVLVFLACAFGSAAGGVQALEAHIRFSRLLRRPSDPRTATVMASKRGGRTLILDIIPRDGTARGYQWLSEVPLALWMKAGMLVPGETVNVYGEPGSESPLLISSTERGRAFLGAGQSAPDRPSDAASTDDWPARNAAVADPHAPADRPSDAASTPTDGSAAAVSAAGGIPGWTPPPPSWSPDAADTRPFWRQIPAGCLIAGALITEEGVLIGARTEMLVDKIIIERQSSKIDKDGRRHYLIRAIPYQHPQQQAERLKAVREARVKIIPRV
jgi:hypothetical protein